MNGLLVKHDLRGKKIAILVAHGFEQIGLEKPRQTLTEAGAFTQIVSPEEGRVRAWDQAEFGNWFNVEAALGKAQEADFDALLLPGGVMNPDKLRGLPAAIRFVRSFFAAKKVVAAICHAPQVLIDAGVVRRRKLTSHPSIKVDLINAGAKWLDQPVVVDRALVTSRRPEDLPAFNEKLLEEIGGTVPAT